MDGILDGAKSFFSLKQLTVLVLFLIALTVMHFFNVDPETNAERIRDATG